MAARIHFERENTVIPSDNITGTGTVNRLAKFTAPNVIGDSLIFDNGASVNNTGAGDNTSNTAFGGDALINNTDGVNTSAFGAKALENNATGVNNTGIGTNALTSNSSGDSNVAVGAQSLRFNATGSQNAALGYQSLYENTDGINNSAVGRNSLLNNTSGSENTAIGENAGTFIADGSTANQTGSQNVFIGTETKANADGDTNEIVIGYNAIGNGTNSVVLGNDDITSTELKGDVTISDYTEGALSTTNTGLIQLEPTFKNLSFGESYANLKTEDYLTNGFTVNPTDVGYQYAKLIQSDLLNKSSILLIPQATKESVLGVNRGADLDVVRATGATRVNSDGLIEEVAINVPRIDYTGGGCGKLLLEPQRTNFVLYSEEFDNAYWVKNANGVGVVPVVTANQGIAPDGSNTAERVVFDNTGQSTSNDFSLVEKNLGSGLSADISISVWVKSNDANNYNLYFGRTTQKATIIEANQEWQRYKFSYNDAFAILSIGLRGTTGSDDTADILVWGAQLEEGSYATSYIPTVAAAVTRNADAVSKTGISSLIGQTEGTIFLYFDILSHTRVVGNVLASISDSTVDNRITIFLNTIGDLRIILVANGITELDESITSPFGNTKIGLAYKSGQNALYINGVEKWTTTDTFTFASVSRFAFNNYDGDAGADNPLKQAIVFPTRLTNSELETLTTL